MSEKEDIIETVEKSVENVENPEQVEVVNEVTASVNYAEELAKLNETMQKILTENEQLKNAVNKQFQMSTSEPPPPEGAVDAYTYEQLAEKLVNDPNSITSRFVADYERSRINA